MLLVPGSSLAVGARGWQGDGNLEFEDAARLRDEVKRLREEELGL